MAALDFPNPAVTPAFMPANSTAYAWNGTVWLGNRMAISAAAASPTIAFRSLTNTTYASRVSTTLTPPAGLTNGDILIATLLIARGTAPFTPSLPAGFAEFGTATQVTDGGLVADLHIYWKRAASESGDYVFTTVTTEHNTQGVMKAYSGCKASGTPLAATSNNTGTGSAASGTSITTTAANSWLLYVAHDWEATSALTPPTGMTERFDNLVYVADQLIAAAGATGTRSQTNANTGTGRWAVRMVELLAA